MRESRRASSALKSRGRRVTRSTSVLHDAVRRPRPRPFDGRRIRRARFCVVDRRSWEEPRMRSPIPAAVTSLALAALFSTTPAPALAAPVALPPPEESARQALDHSPRHGEWVDVEYAAHEPLRTWVA